VYVQADFHTVDGLVDALVTWAADGEGPPRAERRDPPPRRPT
jgi:hypothetical protein